MDNSKPQQTKEGKQRPKGESLGFLLMSYLVIHTISEGKKEICLEICFTATTNFHTPQTAPNWDSSFGAQQLSAISFIYSISKSQTQRLLVQVSCETMLTPLTFSMENQITKSALCQQAFHILWFVMQSTKTLIQFKMVFVSQSCLPLEYKLNFPHA